MAEKKRSTKRGSGAASTTKAARIERVREALEDSERNAREFAVGALLSAAAIIRDDGADYSAAEAHLSDALFSLGESRGIRNAIDDLTEEGAEALS